MSSKSNTSRTEPKGKESAKRSKKSLTNSDGTRTTWETIRWVLGVVIFLFSLYALASIVSHFFVWSHDWKFLHDSDVTGECRNVFGPFGAHLGDLLTGRSFGFFGLLVPVLGMLFGLMLILERSRVLWRATISIMLITIFGSLTLGSVETPDEAKEVADSFLGSGWGGAYGNVIKTFLYDHIGWGVYLLLVACWIITGVVINLNFINFLKRTTENGVETSKSAWESMKIYFAERKQRKEEERLRREEERLLREEEERLRAEEEAREDDSHPEDDEMYVVGGGAVTFEKPAQEEISEEEDEYPFVDEEQEEEMTQETLPENQRPTNITEVPVHIHTDGQVSSTDVDKRRQYNPDSTPDYKFPSIECLVNYESGVEVSNDEIEQNKQRIEEALGNFGVPIVSMSVTIGPTVTLYEIVQEPGVKVSKVQNLEKDIAQSLKALGIRIIAPIPGKGTIGIEVPNRNKETVSMRSAIQSEPFQKFKAELPVVIGRTIQNVNYVFDLAKMPHLLVAGATGQGKSVGLNAIIASLLYRKDPSQLKFVLIDPKTVEFSLYSKLEKHFLAKMASEDKCIVTDSKKAVYTLNSLCVEMENRLVKCGNAGVRNIVEYNDLVRKREVEDDIMPYIVVVIDEFADLIMTAKEVEQPVMRLAQKARAIGIHLIVATQRPDVKVITGTIKANFPARIAFRVMQMIDSRTIIDQPGAQQLIGRGDMLFSNGGELTRIQCAFVDTPEVREIVEHVSNQPFPYPSGTYLLPDYEDNSSSGGSESNFGSESSAPMHYDEHFAEVARDAVASGRFSTSHVQSVYNVGFNRAGRITRQLEQAGIIGPSNGAKPRDVKIYDMESLEALLQELGVE